MTEPVLNRSDLYTEEKISVLLRAGVTLSAVVVLAGGILYLVQQGGTAPMYHQFADGVPVGLRSVTGVLHAAATLRSTGLMQLGVLLLILTPIARVVFSVFVFAQQRDRLYVVITLIVLAVLLYNLIGGYR